MPDAPISLRIAGARDLGPQFTDNPHRMIGQDGAYSIPCGSRTLWFFGDTLIGTRTPGESIWYPGGMPVGPGDMSGKGGIDRMLNNSGLLLSDHDAREGLRGFRYICDSEGHLRTLLPLEPGEHPDRDRVWCLHGICLDGKVVLYFIKVEMLAEGPFPVNFRIVGSGMAVGDSGEWRFRRVTRNGSCILWGEEEPHFATAVLPPARDGWLYMYGSRQDRSGTQAAYCARVTPGNIERPECYEYLASPLPSWSPSPAAALPAFHDMPNELSVSFNRHLGCYLAVHSLGLSGEIVGRTADSPWGPWSAPSLLWRVRPSGEHTLPYPRLIYAGKEHPGLSREGGRILYITYIEFEEYFPHLVEVALA
jgi:hypothetical protein